MPIAASAAIASSAGTIPDYAGSEGPLESGLGRGRVAAARVDLRRRWTMLSWALIFLIVALIAAALGFTGVAGTAAGIAKILFVIFLVLFLVSLLL